MLKRASASAALLLSLTALAACGSESADKESNAADSDATTVSCEYPAAGEAARDVDAPPAEAIAEGEATVVVDTTQGEIGLTLDRESAPCTVNSFVSLAEQGFYDDTPCPRLGNQPGFAILQCGDPTGTGSGGPGYSFDDELSGKETYEAGTIAMANAGANTNGSQFFFIFEDSQFPPNYTVLGSIDEAGLEVLRTVAEAGDDGSHPAGGGAPLTPLDITSITVS